MKDEKFRIIETKGKVAQTKNKQDYIVVQRIDPLRKGATPYVDVRMFFTNSDGELRPTKRGVRIYEDILIDVVATILGALTPEELETVLPRVAKMNLTQNGRLRMAKDKVVTKKLF